MKTKVNIFILSIICVICFATNTVAGFNTIKNDKVATNKSDLLNNEEAAKHPGFTKTKKGLYYKFHTHNEKANKPKVGDILIGEFTVRILDSTLATNASNPGRFTQVDTIQFDGDINEGLVMLGIGDSATFIVSSDSLRSHHMNLPDFVKAGADMYFEIKLTEILTKEAFEKEKLEASAKKEKTDKVAKEKETADINKYLKDNNININPTKSGLYHIIIREGNGKKPQVGQKVKVNYVGMFLDGKVFDTSVEAEAKKAGVYEANRTYAEFEFELGRHDVIQGWDEAIAMMKVGEKAVILLPSSLAYGDTGAGGIINPYTPLVFEVELLEIK